MGIISYAQNFEDVMLWRALKDVKNGFYIDIGANDPVEHSVTKSMYDLGWNGINCEPVEHWFSRLEEDRLNDINLQVAIGKESTELKFYEVVNTGLSTLNEQTAYKHADKLGFEVKNYVVPINTLTEVCYKYKVSTIHFLKIDVEGAEKSVLEGIDFKKIRPWIILIEATKPMSQEVDYEEWEYLITSEKYHFVYFDGLNRFYIADEHIKLDSHFKEPPNVFDGFVLNNQVNAEQKASEAEQKASEAEQKASEAEQKASEAEQKASEAEQKASEAEQKASEAEQKASEAEQKASKAEQQTHEFWLQACSLDAKLNDAEQQTHEWWIKATTIDNNYNMIVNSNSWKITRPLRIFVKVVKWFIIGSKSWITFSPASRPRRLARKILKSLKNHINDNPKLKFGVMKVLNRFPKIKARLKRIGSEKQFISNDNDVQTTNVKELSSRGINIYNKLKSIQRKSKS